MLTFLVFDAKDSLPLQFWGRTWRDRGSKEYPFGDTHVKQFPNIPLRKMPQPRLSTGLAMLLTECFSFHLAMNWKRRVQDTEWLRFHFWDVTTKNHSWAQKIWRWKTWCPFFSTYFQMSNKFFHKQINILLSPTRHSLMWRKRAGGRWWIWRKAK